MYVFLLMLGSFIAVAGLGLVASGVSIQEHTFDASNLTPGMIAIIGGCILIGLGLVVRALLRVERALRGPVALPVRADEAAGSVTLAQEGEAASVALPPKSKPKAIPQPQPASAPAAAVPPPLPRVDATVDGAQIAAQERLESTPLVEESDVSLLPKPPVRAEEETGEVHHNGARANGSAHAATAPRVAANGRPIRPPQAQVQAKTSIFDALWPKQQRAAAEVQAVVPAEAAAPAEPEVPQQIEASESPPPARSVLPPQPERAERAVVSVLKSGVVEGMAYTLYSDGSIEAQLPGGTLRFGSITELRNHIEQHG
jgi:hypothetical protein